MATAWDQDFPLPGSTLFDREVIASTWLNDDYRRDFPDAAFDGLALVLLLNATAPYYTVTQITKDGDGPWLFVGEAAEGDARHNIVPAVACYEDNGGDY